MKNIISVRNLGKKYTISHHKKEPYATFRDVIYTQARNFYKKIICPKSLLSSSKISEEFWALKEVYFDINQGDRVGVIGRNGAGKSTLLKILSRIAEPTTGSIHIKGRVASLLEVGTGFHPELTGRENIYLNGAILGMSRAEIKRKFDEIVDFSEVEKFLDTPVKRYSSGMYIRLAFSVAAHLDPEILIVDEVLAVGDSRFQQKCLGKMQEVGNDGKTVLFVSHNMNAIEHLCNSAIILNKGRAVCYGADVQGAIRDYLINESDDTKFPEWVASNCDEVNPWFQLLRFRLTDEDGKTLSMPISNDYDVWVELYGYIERVDDDLTIGYQLYSEDGYPLYWTCQKDSEPDLWPSLSVGFNTIRSKLPRRFLNEGRYRVEMIGGLYNRQWIYEPNVNSPSVFLEIEGGLSDSPFFITKRKGLLAPIFHWERIYE